MELAHSSRLLLSEWVCVLIILVLCDSPRTAVWPRTGLWFGRPPHSPLRLQINHWNPGTFPHQFFGTVLCLTSVATQHPPYFIHTDWCLPWSRHMTLEGLCHAFMLWRIQRKCFPVALIDFLKQGHNNNGMWWSSAGGDRSMTECSWVTLSSVWMSLPFLEKCVQVSIVNEE